MIRINSDKCPSEQVAKAMREVYKMGLTTSSGGNISIVDQNGNIWISPSQTDKGLLKASEVVCITKSGDNISNNVASSELPFHKSVYKANSNIKAVVHVHSAGVLGLSLLPENKIQPIFDNIKHLTGKIGFCDYHQSGSIELADNLANKAKNLYSAVIMKRHGLVIFSESLEEAITKIQIVEDISIYILLSIKSKKIPKINIPDFILNFQPHQTNKNKIQKEINQFINRLINSKIASPLYCIFVIRFKISFCLVFVSGNKIFTRIYLDDSINSDIINERQLTHFFNHNPHINIAGFFFPIHVMSLIQIVPDFPSNLTAESNLILKSIQTCNLHSINNLFSEAFQKWTTETNALVFPNTGFFTAAQNYFQVFDRIEVAENLAKSLHLIIHSNENVQLPD